MKITKLTPMISLLCLLLAQATEAVTNDGSALSATNDSTLSLDYGSDNSPQLKDIYIGGVPMPQAGGTDVGGDLVAQSGMDPSWTIDAVVVLESAEQEARAILLNSGKYFDANKRLVQGFREALEIDAGIMTFTKAALIRGQRIFQLLGVNIPTNDRETLRDLNQALNNYYRYVIDDVAGDIDLDWYRLGRSGYHFDHEQLELRQIRFAARQLEFLNYDLAQLYTDYDANYCSMIEGEAFPVGHAFIYLRTAEYLALAVAQDLQTSMYGSHRFGVRIGQLKAIHRNLEKHNSGTGSVYGDDRLATNIVYSKISEILDELHGISPCR